MQDDRFSIYIFTKYKKNTAFQTSPAEKKKTAQISNFSFKQKISGRNYCKFQAETRIKCQIRLYVQISKPYEQNRVQTNQTDLRQNQTEIKIVIKETEKS